MYVKALRTLKPGEEIFATYGPDYGYGSCMDDPDVQQFFCTRTGIDCSDGFAYDFGSRACEAPRRSVAAGRLALPILSRIVGAAVGACATPPAGGIHGQVHAPTMRDAFALETIYRGEVTEKYRLVTRSDFDGLVCAMLLKELGMLDDIKFVHPKDMQDGKIEVTDRDITTNVPYVPGVHLAFDHHLSETHRVEGKPDNHIIDPEAPSAARVVYDYYGGKEKFPRISEVMMAEVDKADAAQFTREEILKPTGWVMLNYIMDPRTGLGRFRDFRISNYQLMMDLIEACLTLPIEEVLALPDVKERVDLYTHHQVEAQDQILCCSRVHGNLVVLDLLEQETIHPSNRFLIYALFPKCNISMHVLWGLKKQNVVFAIGKSILDRSSKTSVGDLALQYGGGGHNAAGTCQIDTDKAETVRAELIAKINADG